MKGSRILALALALIMVMALVPATAEDEPVKISVASYMFGPIDNEKDVITPLVEQQLKEKHGLNVDIEVVYIEHIFWRYCFYIRFKYKIIISSA